MSDDNERRDQELYRYPGSSVLRNRRGIQGPRELEKFENEKVTQRILEGVPSGTFDLGHLRAIHRHLFQDVYPWAGEIRQTNIAKTHAFHPHDRIEIGMADIHKRLSADRFLRERTPSAFVEGAAHYIGDVNRLHPFREGNGRTQLQYLKQLAAQAGHPLDLRRFQRQSWLAASIAANDFDEAPMRQCIAGALEPRSDHDSDRLKDLRERYKAQGDRKPAGQKNGNGQSQ